ncbi:hypothetical protein AVEN_239438-1 [Araneus ventricosus]|uniref:Uncharacterized protein n=1 Tax=Araneus ventricosus TaxID=182803 RepID=A0A4Y2A6L3_ARAVE|nr:hypothetical protein AVEN_239438-1 [Araneus ventricosus]
MPNKSSNHKHVLSFQSNHWKGSQRNDFFCRLRPGRSPTADLGTVLSHTSGLCNAGSFLRLFYDLLRLPLRCLRDFVGDPFCGKIEKGETSQYPQCQQRCKHCRNAPLLL